MPRTRAILRETVDVSKRISSLFSLPTVLFVAGVGPFVWGLHLVYEPLAWIVPSGSAVVLAVWLALPTRGTRPKRRGDS